MVPSKIPSSPLDNRESIITQAAAMGLQLSDDGQNWVHITEDQQSTDNDERSGMGFFSFIFYTSAILILIYLITLLIALSLNGPLEIFPQMHFSVKSIFSPLRNDWIYPTW